MRKLPWEKALDWRRNIERSIKKIKSVLKVKAEKYPVKEEEYQLDFPASYDEIKEG